MDGKKEGRKELSFKCFFFFFLGMLQAHPGKKRNVVHGDAAKQVRHSSERLG